MPEIVEGLIGVNKQMADIIDRMFAMLTRYVPPEELEAAGILRKIREVSMERNRIGEGGGSDDE